MLGRGLTMKKVILGALYSFAALALGGFVFIYVAEQVANEELNNADIKIKNTNKAIDAKQDCSIPAYAKAIGNDDLWLQHNGCPPKDIKSISKTENNSLSISSIAVSHPLPIDQAFDIQFINNSVQIDVNDQYKLYKDKLHISVENADLGEIILPEGKEYKDELIGENRRVLVGMNTIPLPISNKKDGAAVLINYQGCWDGGVCYPPSTKKFILN